MATDLPPFYRYSARYVRCWRKLQNDPRRVWTWNGEVALHRSRQSYQVSTVQRLHGPRSRTNGAGDRRVDHQLPYQAQFRYLSRMRQVGRTTAAGWSVRLWSLWS